ncbi:hypothetical protein [Sphingomonas phyllosphaerae]|uniref:hypothetical protein n=1 Tax=Sphingomonas phyllosphaerae TaxID=257003 RepID=UPI0012DD7512|nr:hypothetical protein [Sphingomonas phyllosphaerae]
MAVAIVGPNYKDGHLRRAYLTKMEGIDWNSVGDIVAMAALSNAQMDTAYPANTTILSLFDDRTAGRPAATRLTDF